MMNSCGGLVVARTPCSARPGSVRQVNGVAVGVGLGALVAVGCAVGVGVGGISFAEAQAASPARRKR